MNMKLLVVALVSLVLLGGFVFAQSENANDNAKNKTADPTVAKTSAGVDSDDNSTDDETSDYDSNDDQNDGNSTDDMNVGTSSNDDSTDDMNVGNSSNETSGDSGDNESDTGDKGKSGSAGKSKEAKEKVNRGRIISQIASTTGGDKAGKMDDVVRYVKEAMENPELGENETADEFYAQIKTKALEIIYSAINESDNVSLGNTTGVIDEINVSADDISLDNSALNATGKDITVETDGGNVTVSQEVNGVKIVDSGNTSVSADAISIANGSLVYNGEQIEFPSKIRAKIKANVQSMELVQERGEAAYKAKTKTKAKFIGLFDVVYDGESVVDAQSGEEISSQMPWWAFMAFN